MTPRALLLLLLACGAAAPSPPLSPPPEDVVSEAVLVQLDIQPSHSTAQSLRVLPDGRMQARSAVAYSLGEDHRVKATEQTPEWRPVKALSEGELERLRAAVIALDPASLQDRYTPATPVEDGTTLTWTFGDAGPARQVVIEGYPSNRVAPLEELYRLLNALQAPPQPSSVWNVDGVAHLVPCDANALPPLRPVLRALFNPGHVVASPQAGDAVQVLELTYLTEGRETARVRLQEDGTLSKLMDGQESVDRVLSADGVAEVKAALDAVDWGAIDCME
ncbi:MAG: hypothetical protein H6741_31160 [Alphaproteobacteria bacterium]|nr:hypothetical protein [Alphaproteobacteria bacterium]